MDISSLQWGLTIALIVGLLAYDFIFHARKPHEPTVKEAAMWTGLYVSLALLFGLLILFWDGPTYAAEYYAGFVTEQALSVDKLFVFLIIMASFKVPRADQQKVLLFGIVVALIARTVFIFVGAAAINRWSALFYCSASSSSTPPATWSRVRSRTPRRTTTPTTSWSGWPSASSRPRTSTTATSSSPRSTASA